MSVILSEQPLFLTIPVAFGFGRAFVDILFALGDAKFDFHFAGVVEVEHQWDQRHALPLRSLPKLRKFAL